MAFDAAGFTVRPTTATYGSGPEKVLYEGYYITPDAAATVEGANYFNAAAKSIPDGGFAIVQATMAVTGTVKLKSYLLKRTGASVAATLHSATAG